MQMIWAAAYLSHSWAAALGGSLLACCCSEMGEVVLTSGGLDKVQIYPSFSLYDKPRKDGRKSPWVLH